MRYWTFKHKPGTDAKSDKTKEIVEWAIRLNSAIMQYEYNFQDKKMTSLQWNSVLQINEGDTVLLRGDKNIYAVGKAIKPRKKNDVLLSAKKIINNNSHGEYYSGKYNGCIAFEDSSVFYLDLSEGEEGWGQRIDVDNWNFYNPGGIYLDNNDYEDNSNFAVVRQLKNEEAIKYVNLLKTRYMENLSVSDKSFNLLKRNKNIILTGAPGTGKTYLAKQIAIDLNRDVKISEQIQLRDYISVGDTFSTIEGLPFTVVEITNNNTFNIKPKEAQHNRHISSVRILNCIKEKTYNGPSNLVDEASYIFSLAKYIVRKDKEQYIEFVQFHPSYDYTDFVEGLRPIKEDNKELGFQFKDGTFKAFCKKAMEAFLEDVELTEEQKRKYIIVIDEINRGEISKIFGELFFSIESGYRGLKGRVKTQYSNLIPKKDLFEKGFYVPENVYIIGTMNDIDRSVESFDFAMRRRFTWIEIKADDRTEMLEETIPEWKDIAIKKMKGINTVIQSIEGLNSSYHIGPAYFLKLKDYDGDFSQLWYYHIKPLIKEYLRGLPNAITDLNTIEKAFING